MMKPKTECASAKEYYSEHYHIQTETNGDNLWLYGYICALDVGSVFEFGCNCGRHLAELRKQGCEVSGVDINEKAALAAMQLNGVSVQAGDETLLAEFDDDSFDLVLTNSVLSHIEDTDAIIEQLHRIARKHVIFVETCSKEDERKFWWPHDYPGECVRSYPVERLKAMYQVWHLRK